MSVASAWRAKFSSSAQQAPPARQSTIETFLTRLSIKNEGTPNTAIAAQETVTVEMIANPMAFH
jgi:hypothetical protein